MTGIIEVINPKIEIIEKKWKEIYEINVSNPNIFSTYLKSITIDDIGVTVLTVLEWLKSIDDSKKNQSPYKLSKEIMLNQLAQCITVLENIAVGNYNQISTFIVHLNQLLISLYPLTFLNNYDKSSATLSSDLATAIASIKNLDDKIEKTNKLYSEVLGLQEKTLQYDNNLDLVKNSILGQQSTIDTYYKSIEKANIEVENEMINFNSNKSIIETFSKSIETIQKNNDLLSTQFEQHNKDAITTKELIDKLLPGATSAGLASAFAKKVSSLTAPKYIWLSVFIGSLIWLSIAVSEIPTSTGDSNIWKEIISHLPIISAPIWLAWFSSRSYGHITRLQEKYSYKEAMSRAFEGYKKQMSEISADDTTGSLDTKLSLLSISVLAENPSNIFERGCSDETPFHSVLNWALNKPVKKG